MEEASRFEGHWEVDHSVSDSIEPMLKAMGVSLMIRKIAKSVKVTQEIRVKDDQFIVNNISKHAQDKTIHYINAGPRTILTNRGEKVVDTCTFDASREFPIQIQAVLPGDKGATIDKRKIVNEGHAFIQHLIFKPPPSPHSSRSQSQSQTAQNDVNSQNEDEILMIRTFRRVQPPPSLDPPQIEPEPAVTAPQQPPTSPEVDTAEPAADAEITANLSESSTDPTPDAAPASESREASLHRWMLVVTAAAAANVVTLLFQEWGDEAASMAMLIVLIPGLLFRLLRVRVSAALATAVWTLYIAVVLFATEQAIAQGAVVDVELARFSSWTFCAMTAMLCVLEQVDASGVLSRRHWIFLTLLTSSATAAPLIAGNRFVELGFGHGKEHLGMAMASFLFTCYAGLRVVSCFGKKEDEAVTVEAGAKEDGKEKEVESVVDLLIPEFRIVDGVYTQYRVSVSCAEGEWEVWRRYSQFHALRAALRKHTGKGVLPSLPPKTMFASMEHAFLEQRRERLEEFMRELVEMNGGEMVRRKLVRNFLGLGQGRGKKMKENGAGMKQIHRRVKEKKDPNADEEVLGNLKKCKVNMEKAFTCGDEDGWTFIGKKHGVQCYLKESNGLTFTKGVGVVDAPAEVIVNYTADMSTRKTYDDLHKKDTILHTLDPAKIGEALDASVDLAEIRHSEFKSPFVVISPRDTVMASCRIRSENGVFTTLLVSVKGYKKPSSKYVRANVLSAGIKLEPVPGNPEKCIMTNVQCMDPNGAIPQWVVKAVAPERCAMSAMLNKHVSKKEVWQKYGSAAK